MPQFARPENFHLLWLLLLALAVLWLYIRWRKNALNRLADKSLQDLILPYNSQGAKMLAVSLMLAALIFLVFALANLQFGKKPQKARRAGLDLVVAIDISRSMDAQDLKPSRLAQAKYFVQQLFTALPQDRIGLVVFAGNAYIQMPLTTDLQAATMLTNTINTEMAPTQGTSVGDAITQSMNLLFPQGQQKGTANSAKVIVVLSDGEDHEERAVEAAKQAKEVGALIYTVGIGSAEGSVIPVQQNGGVTVLKDDHGETVYSKLNQEVLQEIAEEGNGKYFYLAANRNSVKNMTDELGKLKRGELEVQVFDEYESYFQVFAAIALLLLLAEPFSVIFAKSKRTNAA